MNQFSPHSTVQNGQAKVFGRIPVYPIPYEYPTVEGIKDILHRIRIYFESTSSQTVIHAETGAAITDFSQVNKYARVSDGFSSEWSYTNGVVLSAFAYLDDVIDDDAFFANNTRFYDFVVKHLPYFRKNAAEFGKVGS